LPKQFGYYKTGVTRKHGQKSKSIWMGSAISGRVIRMQVIKNQKLNPQIEIKTKAISAAGP